MNEFLNFLIFGNGQYELAIAPAVIAGIYLASAAYSAYQANKKSKEQKAQADKLGNIKQPPFNIPQSQKDALGIAKQQASLYQIPGYRALTEKIGSQTASGYRYATETASSPVDALATASAMKDNENSALVNLGIEGKKYQSDNIRQLIGQENIMSGYETMQQEWNTLDPYLRAKATESALRAASNRNEEVRDERISSGIMGAAQLYGGGGGEAGKTAVTPEATTTPNQSAVNPIVPTTNYATNDSYMKQTPLPPYKSYSGSLQPSYFQNPSNEIIKQRFIARYGFAPTQEQLILFNQKGQ
jgi:hypothetical protein